MKHPSLDARNNKQLLRAEYHKMEAAYFENRKAYSEQLNGYTLFSSKFKPHWKFPYNKIGTGPVRPRFIQTTYHYLIEDLNKEKFGLIKEDPDKAFLCTHQIAFTWEISICIQYLHNQVLDGKAGVIWPNQISNNIQRAKSLKTGLYDYLNREITKPENLVKIKSALSKVFLYVDVGQYLERILSSSTSSIKAGENTSLSIILRRLENDLLLYFRNKKKATINRPVNEWSKKQLNSIKKELILDNICDQFKIDLAEEQPLKITQKVKSLINSVKRFISDGPFHSIIREIYQVNNDQSKENEQLISSYLIYFQKTYLTCAASYLTGFELIWEVLTVNKSINQKEELNKYRDNLSQSFRYFGLMRQLVNDITDVTPVYLNMGTAAKWPRDAFSDLKNKNITLLLKIHLLNQDGPDDQIRSFLESEKKRMGIVQHHKFLISLISSGALHKAQHIAKRLSKIGLAHLDKKNGQFHNYSYFFSIAYCNKFYARLSIYQKWAGIALSTSPSGQAHTKESPLDRIMQKTKRKSFNPVSIIHQIGRSVIISPVNSLLKAFKRFFNRREKFFPHRALLHESAEQNIPTQ